MELHSHQKTSIYIREVKILSNEEVTIIKDTDEESDTVEFETIKGCPREVHIVRGMDQVLVTTQDPQEHIDYLIDRALIVMESIKDGYRSE